MQNHTFDFDLDSVILDLIKDDLLNFKIVQGLESLGLGASAFRVKILESVFLLMGFEEKDLTNGIRDWYCTISEKVSKINVLRVGELDDLAKELHEGLKQQKQEIKSNIP